MNLIKSTGTFSFFTLISRLTGYLRDILIAIFLGAGPIADAFFVAFRIPNTFRRLFSEGTFNAAFVPSYSSELNKSKKSAELFANNIFNILFLSLLVIVFIIEIFMPLFVALIAPGFTEDSEKLEITITLTRITFPFLLFVSLSSFFSAILNSHNKFAAASATPIILNILLILVLLFGKFLSDNLVYYISYVVTFAGLIQLIFLIFFVRKYFIPKISFKFKSNKKTKLFFKKLFPSIFSSGVTQINILVGTIIASFQANAVSYLYYADRIYQINLAIAGIAIGTVLLPSLSKYINSKNLTKIDFIQNKSLELSLFLSLPAFALIKVFSSFLFARHNTKTPFHFSIVSVLLNIFISVYFFNKIGFIIIPIATTISSWVNTFLLLFYVLSKKYFSFYKSFPIKFLNILFVSFFSSYIFYKLIQNFNEYLIYESDHKLLTIVLLVIITFLIYIITSIATKAFKISDIKLKY